MEKERDALGAASEFEDQDEMLLSYFYYINSRHYLADRRLRKRASSRLEYYLYGMAPDELIQPRKISIELLPPSTPSSLQEILTCLPIIDLITELDLQGSCWRFATVFEVRFIQSDANELPKFST